MSSENRRDYAEVPRRNALGMIEKPMGAHLICQIQSHVETDRKQQSTSHTLTLNQCGGKFRDEERFHVTLQHDAHGPSWKGVATLWKEGIEPHPYLHENNVFVKLALNTEECVKISREAETYHKLDEMKNKGVTPYCYGYFANEAETFGILVLEQCMDKVRTHSLENSTDGALYETLYKTLIDVHKATGLTHTQLVTRDRNTGYLSLNIAHVVLGARGKVRILGWGHAQGHRVLLKVPGYPNYRVIKSFMACSLNDLIGSSVELRGGCYETLLFKYLHASMQGHNLDVRQEAKEKALLQSKFLDFVRRSAVDYFMPIDGLDTAVVNSSLLKDMPTPAPEELTRYAQAATPAAVGFIPQTLTPLATHATSTPRASQQSMSNYAMPRGMQPHDSRTGHDGRHQVG